MKKELLFIVMVFISTAFISCNNGSSDSSGSIYKVTGPAEASAEMGTFTPQEISLQTDAPGGGPDSSIEFKSATLPSYVSLNSLNGTLTVINADWSATSYDVEITVWTENTSGDKSEDFVLTLHLTTG